MKKKLVQTMFLSLTTLVLMSGAAWSETTTFDYTGVVETYTVPSGVTSLIIEAWGASGGGDPLAGKGAYVARTLDVTPDEVLYVYVGGEGVTGDRSVRIAAGGWNGGGSGFAYSDWQAGGGGASDVRKGGQEFSNRVIVAGGGGGYAKRSTSSYRGGDGGAPNGGTGIGYLSTTGTGGTTSAGGRLGGIFGIGASATTGSSLSSSIGGGGGGYWGGGIKSNYGGGGGGSSYAGNHPSAIMTAGENLGNGQIRITESSCPVVTVADTILTYDGNVKKVTADTIPLGINVTITYTQNGSPATPRDAGDYTVVASVNDSLYPSCSNSGTGTLTINKKSVNTAYIGFKYLTLPYDGSVKSAGAYYSNSRCKLYPNEPCTLQVDETYSPDPPINVGTYTVVGTINDPNYQGSKNATMTISKGIAAISFDNLTRTYNGEEKPVTVTTGPADLTVDITYNGSATPPTSAGSYSVSATVVDDNWQGTKTGTLVINKAPVTVDFLNLNQTYDKGPKQVTVATVPTGVPVDLTYNGSSIPPTEAGNYFVVGTTNDNNYIETTKSAILTIQKAVAGVTLNELVQNYDGSPRPASATTNPAGLTVDLTYEGSPTPPTAPGTYIVMGMVNDLNYSGLGFGILSIAQVIPEVKTTAISGVTTNGALSGGNVTFDGGSTITERGVCWNASGSPTRTNNCGINGSGTGFFVTVLNGLKPNTTYYVRAFATNSVGTAYGDEVSLRTTAWTLNIDAPGKGSVTSIPAGIDCGNNCSQLYADNTAVTLTATPEKGAKFIGWTGDADCEDGFVTMTVDVKCTANFYSFPWELFRPAMDNGKNLNVVPEQ